MKGTTCSMETYVEAMESYLLKHDLAVSNDTISILGDSPIQSDGGTNFLKIHTIYP
jgi:pyruvate kinase